MSIDDDTTPDGDFDTAPSDPNAKSFLEPNAKLTDSLEIVRQIGSGGQGDVYEVRDVESGARCAVKVLNRKTSRDSAVVARLQREATTASAISHANVTRIYGLERTPNGDLFLRMELLHGRSLAAELHRRGPLPIELACDLVRQIAEGLSAAHELNVIHRDIKPANVFLIDGPAGPIAKIMDFGIAKAAASWDLTALTHTGSLLGTPAYMSPEQIMLPDQLDHRTDIYSLGLVFYEMLTGRRAFTGTEVPQILMAQVKQPPPDPRKVRSLIPRPIADVVLRCLAKQPASRFSTMRAFIERLDRARLEPDVPTQEELSFVPAGIEAVEPAPRSRLGGVAALFTVVLGGVLGFALWPNTEVAAPVVPAAIEQPAVIETPPPPPPSEGTVRLSSDPTGAVVSLGRTVLGTTPLSLTLAPDVEHGLSIRADGYRTMEVRVRLRAGESWHRHISLAKNDEPKRITKRVMASPPPPPPPPVAPAEGYLTIRTEPWTRISVAGRQLGTTPLFKVKLPAGRHQVRFVNEVAKIDQTRTIEIPAGETKKESIDFR